MLRERVGTCRRVETEGWTPLAPAAPQVIIGYRPHSDVIPAVSLDALHVDLHVV